MDSAVRATVDEQRAWQLRMFEERNEAAKQAIDLEARVSELATSLERVRLCSKSKLLEQVADLKTKVRE